MKPLHIATLRKQRAFSLTEIMVGMVIGLLGTVIIMQMTTLFEARKRTTTSGDDAQNGGAIALYSIQSQITQAGYAISSANLIGKSLSTPNITLNPLTPVTVNPAQLAAIQDANTDSFIVTYGNTNTTTEGSLISNPIATLPYTITAGTGAGGVGDGGKSFAISEWVIPSQSGVTATHTMYQVIGPVSTNVVAVSGTPPTLTYIATNANPPLLFNLGTAPSVLAYAVINGSLSVCDYMANNCAANAASVANGGPWTNLSDGIVSMRLQCEAASTLRIALVARSVQIDMSAGASGVTAVSPLWNPNGVSAPVVAAPATTWGANWKQYRYKTFETVLPIRNAIWSGVRGC